MSWQLFHGLREQIFFALQHERLLGLLWSLSFVALRKATTAAVVFLSTSPNLMSPRSWQILIQITDCYLTKSKSKSNRVNFGLPRYQFLLLLAYDRRLVCFLVLLSFVPFALRPVFRNSFQHACLILPIFNRSFYFGFVFCCNLIDANCWF